jgi:hypothetical protein
VAATLAAEPDHPVDLVVTDDEVEVCPRRAKPAVGGRSG